MLELTLLLQNWKVTKIDFFYQNIYFPKNFPFHSIGQHLSQLLSPNVINKAIPSRLLPLKRFKQFFHCVKYCNFTKFSGVEILWKGTVSAQFRTICPKLCGNVPFHKIQPKSSSTANANFIPVLTKNIFLIKSCRNFVTSKCFNKEMSKLPPIFPIYYFSSSRGVFRIQSNI